MVELDQSVLLNSKNLEEDLENLTNRMNVLLGEMFKAEDSDYSERTNGLRFPTTKNTPEEIAEDLAWNLESMARCIMGIEDKIKKNSNKEDKGLIAKTTHKLGKAGKKAVKMGSKLGRKVVEKLGLKDKPSDKTSNESNKELKEDHIAKSFKAAGSYFKKSHDSALGKSGKGKDKYFKAASLIKSFSPLKNTEWYGKFKEMLEKTKTTVKAEEGKKENVLVSKVFISLLGLKSAENVKTACDGFRKGSNGCICEDLCIEGRLAAFSGGRKSLKNKLRKKLVSADPQKIDADGFKLVASYFKGPWPDEDAAGQQGQGGVQKTILPPPSSPPPQHNNKSSSPPFPSGQEKTKLPPPPPIKNR